LNADPRTQAVPVIMLSARAGEESQIEGIEAGADDYLVKPFSARELLVRVKARLEIARLRREFNERTAADLQAMTRLFEIGNRCMQAGAPFEECLNDILEAAIALTNAAKGTIQLLDGDTLRIAAHHGFEREFLEFFREVSAKDDSAAGRTLRLGQRIVLEDVEVDEAYAPMRRIARASGFRAIQSTPLLSSAGRVVGMISTHFHRPHRPSDRELRLLDLLARQAADFLERYQAETMLRHHSQQFETLVNQAPLGIYVVDEQFRIRQVNPIALPIFGAICGDICGRDFEEVVRTVWKKHYADEMVGIFRRTLATGEPYVAAERIEERFDNGKVEAHAWRVDRIILPEGHSGAVCYFRDIAGEVKARQTQQLLTEELNHRVKNTLAIVQSIAQSTQRRARNPADFVKTFEGRIQSLARAHGMLSNSNWHGADFRDVIHDQLILGPADKTRIIARGPSVHLGSQMTLQVALMLHELGTNAIKYGALSTPKGIVTISWSVAGGSIRLNWGERGGPPPAVPARRGFGTTMIEQTAKGAGGGTDMKVGAEGVDWEIILPLPPPLTPGWQGASSVRK
jgi:PAS domain S-box-containing protein